MKTAGVDASILRFSGRARIFESQDAAVAAILADEIKPGDVLVIRYEGPRGGPGMQEVLYPTSYLKSKGLGKACAPSRTVAFRAEPRDFRLGTPRRKQRKAAPSASSKRTT